MFQSQNSLDYNKPPSKAMSPRNKKILIGVGAVVLLTIIGIAAWLVFGKEDSLVPQISTDPETMSVSQEFVNNLAEGNADKLLETTTLFGSRDAAVETIDWLQSDLDLSACKQDPEHTKIKIEDVEYSQTKLVCPKNIGSKSDKVDSMYLFITSSEDKIRFFEVLPNNGGAITASELHKALEW